MLLARCFSSGGTHQILMPPHDAVILQVETTRMSVNIRHLNTIQAANWPSSADSAELVGRKLLAFCSMIDCGFLKMIACLLVRLMVFSSSQFLIQYIFLQFLAGIIKHFKGKEYKNCGSTSTASHNFLNYLFLQLLVQLFTNQRIPCSLQFTKCKV